MSVRNLAISLAQATGRMMASTEVAYYRRAIKALRTEDPRDRERATLAQLACQDRAEELVCCLIDLEDKGLSRHSEQIMAQAVRDIHAGRHGIAIEEARAGRSIPDIECACEMVPMPPRSEGSPSVN